MKKLLISASALTFALSACLGTDKEVPPAPAKPQASATLAPTQGNAVQGSVVFTQETDNSVRVIAEVSGLTPGVHGFHVHEKGDCSAADGTSAGGHFNPFQQPHGQAGAGPHHVGDMPSLTADDSGSARLNVVVEDVVLAGEKGIVGRGLIVHAAPDDFTTQPTGNAGARVACAVIQSM